MLVMSILFTLHVGASYVSYYPSRQLAYRAVTKLLHPRLSLANPLDGGAPAVVNPFYFRFYSSSPGCLRSTTLPHFPLGSGGLQLW